jgi:hypothetical protein
VCLFLKQFLFLLLEPLKLKVVVRMLSVGMVWTQRSVTAIFQGFVTMNGGELAIIELVCRPVDLKYA